MKLRGWHLLINSKYPGYTTIIQDKAILFRALTPQKQEDNCKYRLVYKKHCKLHCVDVRT